MRNVSRSAKHDSGDNDDLFTPELQAKWFSSLSNTLCSDISDSLDPRRNLFDPKTVVESLANLLRRESEIQGKTVDEAFYESLEELKDDPDFSKIMRQFDEGLNGERNIMTIGMMTLWGLLFEFVCERNDL